MTGRALLLAIPLLFARVSAAPVDLWFTKANEAYEARQYDSAAAYYHRVIDAGVHSSDVYYNLGNTYYRMNRKGSAILYYEKARRLTPNDPDILANIKFANLQIVDRLPPAERTFVGSIMWRLHTLLSLQSQIWILFALLCVLSALVSLGLFASRNARLWVIYLGTLLFLTTGALATSVGLKVHEAERVAYAVVLSTVVDARNEPKGAKVLFTAHEGTKFRIRKRAQGWWLVSLPNGVSGWVESGALEQI